MSARNLMYPLSELADGRIAWRGVPLSSGYPEPRGVWYVDGNVGDNGREGIGWQTAMLTMAQAFTRVQSGDVIFTRGNIREQISAPAGIFDVKIVGVGTRPRHADAHTGNNGYSAATWKAPASPTSTTPLLILRQQGWGLFNILFDGPSDAAAVRLFRDGGSGDAEDDASHAHIAGCKFVAGQNHIEFHGGLSQCLIENNMFFGATADSFLETVGAGIGTNNFHEILNNKFHSNDTHIDVGLNSATIEGNTFGARSGSANRIDLTGGANNMVWRNLLAGTYSNAGGYIAGTNDVWAGNFNGLTGGVTADNPA